MILSDHLDREFRLFGTRTPDVHRDLDSCFAELGVAHRPEKHHLEYVLNKWARGEWNSFQCRVAIHHIIDDCGMLPIQQDWEMSGSAVEILEDEK